MQLLPWPPNLSAIMLRMERQSKGWNRHLTGQERHVWPVDDMQEHDLEGSGCFCNPTSDVLGSVVVIIHNSWDRREKTREVN